jgi:membrane protease YdiL (CAAX protease family)
MDREKEVFLVLSLLTILHFVECLWFVPWSPMALIFNVLAIVIPLKLRSRTELGFKWPERWRDFLIYTILGFIASVIMLVFILPNIVLILLESFGLKGNVQFDYFEAYTVFAELIIQKCGVLVILVGPIVMGTFVEEPLYRGYAFNSLSENKSVVYASTVSSLFFGLRHFVFLTPALSIFPIIPGLTWAMVVIPFGYLMCYVLYKTQSLYASMLVHFSYNLLAIVISWLSYTA